MINEEKEEWQSTVRNLERQLSASHEDRTSLAMLVTTLQEELQKVKAASKSDHEPDNFVISNLNKMLLREQRIVNFLIDH
jgi:hypothetical protein